MYCRLVSPRFSLIMYDVKQVMYNNSLQVENLI